MHKFWSWVEWSGYHWLQEHMQCWKWTQITDYDSFTLLHLKWMFCDLRILCVELLAWNVVMMIFEKSSCLSLGNLTQGPAIGNKGMRACQVVLTQYEPPVNSWLPLYTSVSFLNRCERHIYTSSLGEINDRFQIYLWKMMEGISGETKQKCEGDRLELDDSGFTESSEVRIGCK